MAQFEAVESVFSAERGKAQIAVYGALAILKNTLNPLPSQGGTLQQIILPQRSKSIWDLLLDVYRGLIDDPEASITFSDGKKRLYSLNLILINP